jgi:hypothetical protein
LPISRGARREDVLLVEVIGRSVDRVGAIVPCLAALGRHCGRAIRCASAARRRGGAQAAGQREEILYIPTLSNIHCNKDKTCALPALRGAARDLSLPLPSRRAAPPPLCLELASLRARPRPSPAKPPLPFLLLLCDYRKILPPQDFMVCGANVPRPPKEARRFLPLHKRTFALSIFVRGERKGRNRGMSRARGTQGHPSRDGQKGGVSRRGASQKGGKEKGLLHFESFVNR